MSFPIAGVKVVNSAKANGSKPGSIKCLRIGVINISNRP